MQAVQFSPEHVFVPVPPMMNLRGPSTTQLALPAFLVEYLLPHALPKFAAQVLAVAVKPKRLQADMERPWLATLASGRLPLPLALTCALPFRSGFRTLFHLHLTPPSFEPHWKAASEPLLLRWLLDAGNR